MNFEKHQITPQAQGPVNHPQVEWEIPRARDLSGNMYSLLSVNISTRDSVFAALPLSLPILTEMFQKAAQMGRTENVTYLHRQKTRSAKDFAWRLYPLYRQ